MSAKILQGKSLSRLALLRTAGRSNLGLAVSTESWLNNDRTNCVKIITTFRDYSRFVSVFWSPKEKNVLKDNLRLSFHKENRREKFHVINRFLDGVFYKEELFEDSLN